MSVVSPATQMGLIVFAARHCDHGRRPAAQGCLAGLHQVLAITQDNMLLLLNTFMSVEASLRRQLDVGT